MAAVLAFALSVPSLPAFADGTKGLVTSDQTANPFDACRDAEDWDCQFDVYATGLEEALADKTFCEVMQEGCGYIVVELYGTLLRAAVDEAPEERLKIARRGLPLLEALFQQFQAVPSTSDSFAPFYLGSEMLILDACLQLDDGPCAAASASRIVALTKDKSKTDIEAMKYAPQGVTLPFDFQGLIAKANDLSKGALQ